MQKQKVTGHNVTGFVHFFVDRIQDFFQTNFFIFQTQSEILHGPRRNNCLNYENNEFKKIQYQLFSSKTYSDTTKQPQYTKFVP